MAERSIVLLKDVQNILVRTSFATHISRKHRQSFEAQPPQDTHIQVEDIQAQDYREIISELPTTATKLLIETDMTLPSTPRLIMLGNTFLSVTKWMVSIDGRVAYVLEEHLGFADALSVFFGCFYVFNIEYQEPACATLELIQRFFMRINPEEGTKCTSKTGKLHDSRGRYREEESPTITDYRTQHPLTMRSFGKECPQKRTK
ncbi:uncharacterized protein LOC132893164 [Neoarius graeffei]|uniref:uncharacterized protein LOC132893164 n=1 Tax=Neoarius graeffei TaxID=443677 RepID=UPI00298C324F|nr:uncharacterized protein LOC132893164 [Neoarius graeffei]